MSKKIEIFDPALCCATGVCGPSVDPELTRISRLHSHLINQGFDVHRYNLAQEPDHFANNEQVTQLLEKEGPEGLPAVLVDGNLVKSNSYPTVSEFAEWFGVNEAELETKSPKLKIKLSSN